MQALVKKRMAISVLNKIWQKLKISWKDCVFFSHLGEKKTGESLSKILLFHKTMMESIICASSYVKKCDSVAGSNDCELVQVVFLALIAHDRKSSSLPSPSLLLSSLIPFKFPFFSFIPSFPSKPPSLSLPFPCPYLLSLVLLLLDL